MNDLLEDPEFIRWVKEPEGKLNHYWQSWMEANPDRIEDIKMAREIILGLQFPAREATPDVKREVLNKLLLESQNHKREAKANDDGAVRALVWSGLNQISKIAAILVISLMLSFLFLNMFHEGGSDEAITHAEWMTKATNYGEKVNFRLPDGTVVWMNSGSSLVYPESFDSTVRLVKLSGEAFFEVVKDESKPFQVVSEDLVTTALGTSFNINSKEKGELRISLLTGKVRVENETAGEAFFLHPGQELQYEPETKNSLISSFDPERVQGWTHGKLIFDKADFEEVMDELERWFGISITIEGKPSREWAFSGKFEDQSLDIILKSMSNIEDFEYHIKKKNVVLRF